MTLDAPTLLVALVVAVGVMASAHLVVWAHDRRETAIPWMVAASVLSCTGGLLHGAVPDGVGIVAVNMIVLLGLGCIGTACRALGDRRPALAGLLAAPLVWAVACISPAVFGSQALRVGLASALSGTLMAWALVELWRDRREEARARLVLAVVLGTNGLAAFGRTAAVDLTQAPQPGLLRGADLTLVMLWSLGFLLLAGFSVILVVKERVERRLRRTATLDGLTGLANRRRFDEALAASCADASRRGQPLSLLMIDVDAFKAYNDLCGHPEGDRALCRVAAVLAAAADAAGGLAARYGGEEFAILLPGWDAGAALGMAEALRAEVARLAVPHPGSVHGRLSISIGLATTPPGRARPWDLLREADGGLYAAKRAGRDRVARGDGLAAAEAVSNLVGVTGSGDAFDPVAGERHRERAAGGT